MNLSSLTPTDKIKLAAELDGWTNIHDNNLWSNHTFFFLGKNEAIKPSVSLGEYNHIPNYDTSYDAIIPLILKQSLSTIIAIQCRVCKTVECTLMATPSQLLDALLVETGKAEL